MKRIHLIWAVLAITGLGCGNSASSLPGEGSLNVEYSFNGVEEPSKVTIHLIDGFDSGYTCATLPYDASEESIDNVRNLPVNGSTSFDRVQQGSRWIVWATGTNAGIRVADACKDNVKIRRDQVTNIALTLENEPLVAKGQFATDVEISFDIPTEAKNTLVAFDVACEAFDIDEDACKIADGISNLLLDLDVKMRFDMTQRGDAIHGTMDWVEVEGVPVGDGWKLVEGGFNAEIPGATQMDITSHEMKVNMDQVVLFMVSEVMGYDLEDFGPQVELVMDTFVSDLMIYDGNAVLYDSNFDGQADSMNGSLDAEIELSQLDYVDRFDLAWTAWRQ